jgi:MoxR-like ATPase
MTAPLAPADLAAPVATARALADALDRTVFGQQDLTRLVLTGFLAGGHVLLEGLPGLGKTELIKALAAASGCTYKRIQFTPDLLPSDITGTNLIGEPGRPPAFRPGPVFASVVLADEINRASPKTQSALLEAMQERAVTVLGETRPLPDPFFVLATQNPVELDGTYPLPEAQLDRFAVKAAVAGVSEDVLHRIVAERPGGRPPAVTPVTDAAGLQAALAAVRSIIVPEAVARYIARLVHATRPDLATSDPAVRGLLRWGCGPRAALALAACARASALIDGRPAVGFADVRRLAVPVIAHRLVLQYEAGLHGRTTASVVNDLLAAVPELP